jgi:hypothetical protein
MSLLPPAAKTLFEKRVPDSQKLFMGAILTGEDFRCKIET